MIPYQVVPAVRQLHFEIRRTEWILHYWVTLTPEELQTHSHIMNGTEMTIEGLRQHLAQLKAQL